MERNTSLRGATTRPLRWLEAHSDSERQAAVRILRKLIRAVEDTRGEE